MSVPEQAYFWLAPVRTAFAGFSALEIALTIAAGMIAIYSLSRLWTIGRHETIQDRIAALRANPRATQEGADGTARGIGIPLWSKRLGAVLAGSSAVGSKERTRLSHALADAGWRGQGPLVAMVTAKFLGLLLVVAGVWFVLQVQNLFAGAAAMRIGVLAGAGLGGWRLADIVVAIVARRRKRRIEEGLPDALDLLVICAEAGLSLEQSINFVAREISTAFPEIGKELEITAAELRVLGDRREALDNLGRRIGLPAVRSVVATLVQTLRYGTPLAQSLRVVSAELRTMRVLRIEERAAQLPVLLSIPLVLFILPCTFMVLAGPAILQIIDALGKMTPIPH
jgi:tight adherence protein C